MSSKRNLGILAIFITVAVLATIVLTHGETTPVDKDKQPPKPIPEQTTPPLVEPEVKPTKSDKRPNIVLFLVDDMRVDDLPYMPKTQKLLAKRGISYENMLSVNPLCCPARASLLTGQYTHNNGVLSNAGKYGGVEALKEPNNTLPAWLSKAGYNTAFFGKYLNGYGKESKIPAGWNYWDATIQGTYSYVNFTFSNNGKPERFVDDYITTRLSQRSIATMEDFAKERKASGKPFFLFNSYVAPHYSISAPKNLVAKYSTFDYKKNDGPPIPEKKYAKLHLNDINPSAFKPSYGTAIKNNNVSFYRDLFNTGDWQTEFLRRVQSLASVDDAVAKMVKELKAAKQYNNTVIMFVSDNGYLLGEHMRGGKQVALTESLKVPLMIAGPGYGKNIKSSQIVTMPDVATTIVKLAKAKPERLQDGAAIPSTGDFGVNRKLAVVIENGNSHAKTAGQAYHYRGLFIGGRYTYAEWENPTAGVELYDNVNDPYQLVNLAKSPLHQTLVKIFSNTLQELKLCKGPKKCQKNISYPEVPQAKLIKYLHGTYGDSQAAPAKRAR